jgi:molecular chaperone GrpE
MDMTPPQEPDSAKAEEATPAPAPEAQVAELTDRWLRARAELENVRRAARQEVETARRFGAAPAFAGLLAVVDNLQRALAAPPAGVPEDFLQGLHFIEQQFFAVLSEHGVSRIVPEPGQPLDPRLHQALMEEDAPDLPPGSIVRALLAGYRLHDRLLRPAQVVVARAPAPGA